jgi:hypothetical protein
MNVPASTSLEQQGVDHFTNLSAAERLLTAEGSGGSDSFLRSGGR